MINDRKLELSRDLDVFSNMKKVVEGVDALIEEEAKRLGVA
jgi:hypothetical protein